MTPPMTPPFIPPPVPPVPAGGTGLGAALADGGLGRNVNTGHLGSNGYANGNRPLPAWFDLTGASAPVDAPPSGGAPAGIDPLPQRRPGQWGEPDGEPDFPPAPRQSPEGPSAFGGPPPAARPPVWPPVAEPDSVPGIPEGLSASLDLTSTSEIPRLRGGAAPVEPAADNGPYRYADDMTMELPIFSELESAWFQSGPAPAATGETSDSSAARRAEWTTGSDGAAEAADEVSWRSVADAGWLAAQSATEPRDGGSTEMGLPRRVPMAQLVPGGVETASGGSDRRTPESVRGLLSAYHRGVQRGRDAHGKDADPTGSPTNGREQEA
jgi:hypothetical protein